MSVTLFKKVDYSLSKLLHDIEYGEIGLPDIQRPFVWKTAQVRDLFDSMYKGFPVGYLLFWSNNHFSGARQIGVSADQPRVPHLLIVDGQQRLTSLYAVLKGCPVLTQEYEEVHITIAFRPLDAHFEVSDAAIQKDAEFIPDISKLWSAGQSSFKAVRSFLERLKKSREVTEEEETKISDAIDHLYDLQNYPFTAMEISSTVDEEQVADIFVRINSKGVQLNQSDFILTLLSVFWDEGRTQLEKFSRESRKPTGDNSSSPFNFLIDPAPDQLLRTVVAKGFKRARLQHVYSILRGKDLETGEFSESRRDEQFAVLKKAQAYTLDLQNWHEFLKVLIHAGFRRSSLITSEMNIMYAYAMYLIGKEEYRIDATFLRKLLARWFFMTSITGRYTGSPESVMEQDLARLRGVTDADGFKMVLDEAINAELTNDFWEITLPNNLATSASRSPYTSAYYAALNLLDARVLFSSMRVSELLDPLKTPKNALERHHLFPKAYLKRLGYEDTREINQAANYALVEWGDNNRIADLAPSDYYSQYAARFSDAELQQMMWWHALPDGWHEMDYETFLTQRRRLIGLVTREGFLRL